MSIEMTRYEKEQKLKKLQDERSHLNMISKERLNQDRLQKSETVERIMRANDYKK
jgi:hypothetical protein